MTAISFTLVLLSLWLLDNNGKLTKQKLKRFLGIGIIAVSYILLVIDYGALRGAIIFLAILSLLGTLFTLFKSRFFNY
jgi:hypothetical protein